MYIKKPHSLDIHHSEMSGGCFFLQQTKNRFYEHAYKKCYKIYIFFEIKSLAVSLIFANTSK